MTKTWLVVCLSLSPLLACAGCGGEQAPAEPPGIVIAPPPQPVAPEQRHERDVSSEPNVPEPASIQPADDAVDAVEASTPAAVISEANNPPPTETPQAGSAPIAEPNVPDAPAQAPVTEVPEPEQPEPNLPGSPLPAEEVTETETVPQEAPAEESEPDALVPFYQAYAQILHDYVRKDGGVDYSQLRRKRLRLKQLLQEPDELDPNEYRKWSEDERLAFWINTYNLKMLEIIARNYPIQSSWWLRLTWPPSDIRHIGGIWSDYRFIVMDEEFTLGDVERRVFRRIADPRAYLAITYGSRSGPRLRRTPYRADRLDEQLDEQVRAFLASEQGCRIDRDKNVVHLSALFKPTWRGKEFVARYAMDKKFKDRTPETRAVLNFLTHYLSPDDVYFLEVENYTIVYTNFDWRINDGAMAN